MSPLSPTGPTCATGVPVGEPSANFELITPEGSPLTSPIVVVLGWSGSTERHLAGYAAVLQAPPLRCPTVLAICPNSVNHSPLAAGRRRWAARLLDFLILANHKQERPLVLYALSNGGAYPVEQIDWLVRNEAKYAALRARILGTIFDSAPCYLHPSAGARTLTDGKCLPARLTIKALFYATMPFNGPGRPRKFWERMIGLDLGKTLYLYSQDDTICDAARLKALVQERQKRGHAVEQHTWERSRHVGHRLTHMFSYDQRVITFIQSLMS